MKVEARRQVRISLPGVTTLIALAFVSLLVGKAQAALIAEWQFDSFTTAETTGAVSGMSPEYGTQQNTALLNAPNLGGAAFGSIQGTTLNQAFPSSPNNALEMRHGVSFELTLHVSGTGLNSFMLSYATQQNAGANAVVQTWYYSTDGVNYTALTGGTVLAGATWGTDPASLDFSGITALNGAADVYFQDRFTINGNFNMGFDNIAITAVPEPVNYALAGFGVIFAGISVGRFYLGSRKSRN